MKTKNDIQKELNKISACYHKEIPLSEIFQAVKVRGGIPVMEDGREWEGFLCGKTGNTTIEIKGIKGIGFIYISWYKMESGNFEIVSYLI